jgi:preprotein translocase subunit YajC
VPGLLIIILLFGALYFLMIRPQRAKLQAQQRMLNAVEVGDEVLTVGGIYGIVQELEPDEDGGDLIVEIAEGIHVRIARKGLATVVKLDVDEEDEDDEIAEDSAASAPGGVEEVNDEQVSVDPGAAEGTAPPERS